MPSDVVLPAIDRFKRIARRQIAIFTPLGFMPQEPEVESSDPWGMHGVEWQRHLAPMDTRRFSRQGRLERLFVLIFIRSTVMAASINRLLPCGRSGTEFLSPHCRS